MPKTKPSIYLDTSVDDLERCRRARNAFDRQFKTVDELFDFLKKLEKKGGRRMARVGRAKGTRKTAGNKSIGGSSHVPTYQRRVILSR